LELLWHFTAEFSPQGDIGKFDDRRIEAALGWHQTRWRKHGDLIRALSEAHWIDINPVHRLITHDWHDHADESVRKRLARSSLQFLSLPDKVTGHRQPDAATLAENGSLPLPLPVPEPVPLPQLPREMPPPLSQSEWPLTAAEIRKHDPAVDDYFVLRLVQETVQFCISHGDDEQIDDDDMAAAVKESYDKHTGRNRHGPGLLLKRVPQIMLNWGKELKNGKPQENSPHN
jgi:hypothetical protein